MDLYRKTELAKRQAEALREAQRREHERELAEANRRAEGERARVREELLRREMESHRNQQRWLESVLAALPIPVALVEPGSGRTLLANRAAQGLAGGCLTYREARALHAEVVFRGPDGQPPPDAALPLMRAARGEALRGASVEWELHGQRGAGLQRAAAPPARPPGDGAAGPAGRDGPWRPGGRATPLPWPGSRRGCATCHLPTRAPRPSRSRTALPPRRSPARRPSPHPPNPEHRVAVNG